MGTVASALKFRDSEFTGKRGPAGNEPLSDVEPKLVSIECGIDSVSYTHLTLPTKRIV